MISKRDKAKKLGPIEILVVVFMCLFVIAIIGPAAQMSQFEAYRIQCADNLSHIGRAMLIYANDYDDELPRAGGRNSVWAPTIPNWYAHNRYAAYGMAVDGSGGSASISSCFYLLVKYAEVTPGTFVCPGDAGTTEFQLSDMGAGFGELIDLWDFGARPSRHCSYAYNMPFGFYALSLSDDPSLAIASDRNPWMDSPAATAKMFPGGFAPDGGREAVKNGNAIAHEEEGQNVLFLDFHVAFEDRSFCGVNNDNIYTYWVDGDIRIGSPPALRSEPMDRVDSLLVHDPPPAKGMTIFKQPEVIDSANLRKTSIVATLDSPLPKYQNIIWCSTFQMAWDKLKNDIIGEPVEVVGAEQFAERLNAAEFSEKDIEDESYYATAGVLADGIIEQIQNEMIQFFPSGPVPVFYGIVDLPLETIIAYSYLNADIEFKYPFYINNYEFDFQDSIGMISEVASFCTLLDADSSDLVSEQVDVLYYKQAGRTGGTEFAVDLCKHTYPYQVVVANVSMKKNLDKTVADVEQKIFEFKQQPDYEQIRKLQPASDIRSADTLTVPDMLYKLTHQFTELEGKAISNQPWLDQEYIMGKAMQMTNFTLGRIGVLLRPGDQIVAPPFGQPQQRCFDFNRPFLIYIKKRELSASPFFVMWVDNAELMQEFIPNN